MTLSNGGINVLAGDEKRLAWEVGEWRTQVPSTVYAGRPNGKEKEGHTKKKRELSRWDRYETSKSRKERLSKVQRKGE